MVSKAYDSHQEILERCSSVSRSGDVLDEDHIASRQEACLATLTGLGFAEAELAQSWQGQKDLSLRDHRVQLLIRDATLWREAHTLIARHGQIKDGKTVFELPDEE